MSQGCTMFLAIDTVFAQCSVAIVSADLQVLSCQTQIGNKEQTRQVLPMVDAALQQTAVRLTDITALLFNRGPGAFSGIRINTAVVQALSVAQDIPCVGVSSLAALAQTAFDKHQLTHVYAALDARMQQVYFGEFKLGALGAQTLPPVMQQVLDTDETLLDYAMSTEQALPVIGDGATLLALAHTQPSLVDIRPDAACIAKLGIAQYLASGGVPAEQALPVYLRHHAWKTLQQQGKA